MATTYYSPGVYIEEKPAGSRPIEGVGTAIAGFIGFTEQGVAHQPTLVTSWTQYTTQFGGFVKGAYLPLAVYQYFNNGGGQCYVVRVNGSADAGPSAPLAELPSAAREGLPAYQVIAKDPDASDLSVVVERAASVGEDGQPQEPDDESFTLIVRRGDIEAERFPGIQPKGRSKQTSIAQVNDHSNLVRLVEVGQMSGTDRVPVVGEVRLAAPPVSAADVSPEEFTGDATARTGLGGLEAISDITMIAVPDLMGLYERGAIDLDGVLVMQRALIDHCENMRNRLAILDTPPNLTAQQVHEFTTEKANFSSAYAALYWPWIKVADPAPGARAPIFMPPSGAIAGIWGRNDDTRGVHKAPANEVVRGAIDIAVNVTRKEHDKLNPAGINAIRSFPGLGIRVWGARTLAGSSSEWRYVNVRRYFNYLEFSIERGTQWVVFEPNDLDLWQRVKRTLRAFLDVEYRKGCLFGATPEQAFYVKCDEDLNPASVRDQGYLICEVGVAPVKPAEFVVFRLAQFSGGSEVSE